MWRSISVLLLCGCSLVAQKKPVTIEALARERPARPASPIWAPDGKRFVYQEGRQVWLYDIPSRSRRQILSLEAVEAAAVKPPPPVRQEWQNRNVRERPIQWGPSGKELLVAAGGDLFWHRLEAGGWTQLTATAEAEGDPKLSPDGRRVSFRRGRDLYVLEIAAQKITRLTEDGSDTHWNAQLDWVYPEELHLETAHWWSPDSTRIAYLQFDISRLPLYPHADLLPLNPVYEPQRYPKAGDPNSEVRLGVVPAAGGRTVWMDLGQTRDMLLARVAWAPDSKGIAVQRLNRIQNRLDLLQADPASGASRAVLQETDPHWVNLADDLRFLKDGAELLWSSERSGYRHLYRYSKDGKLLGQVTHGDWEVTRVACVDEAAGEVFFEANQGGPLERHLYRVGLDGAGMRQIARSAGTHGASMPDGCAYYLATHSSLTSPSRRTLHTRDGAEWAVFVEADRKAEEEFEILPTEIIEVKAPDGALLYARLIKPAGFQPGRKYPAVVVVYGGPHSQTVRNAWAGLSLDQVLAHRGFVIWQLDNRGSAGRGRAWEAVVHRNLGAWELEDQKTGLKHLLSLGFVDAARVGITGWSYGGYMTLYSLLNAPDLFAAGVAGAPVTDWRHYDTIYTERYMGLPSDNAEGYRRSSPVHMAANLKAQLMLIHCWEDDNVLFQNTFQMAAELQKAGKHFQLVIYPVKSHGVTGSLSKHRYEATVAFLEEHLKAEK
ncbi:MAG: S9 family peptidase [Acidobacteria bacterium]|nr:S9 family peptidase [Acidobacteriota bacterium]